MQLPADFQTETRCGREGHTRPRGPSESPDGVDPNIRRTRHNVTVITVGSKYEVYVQSPASSHMLTFRTLAIKWEVNIVKKVFLRLSACVFIIESLWYGKWLYNTLLDTRHNVKTAKSCSPHFGLSLKRGLLPDAKLWRRNQQTSMVRTTIEMSKIIQGLCLPSLSPYDILFLFV